MKKIKFFPGVLSFVQFFEPLFYVLAIIYYVVGGYLTASIALCVITFLVARYCFVFGVNGTAFFVKFKKSKLYIVRDLFVRKTCLLSEKTIIYKTKAIGVSLGPRVALALQRNPTVEKDGWDRKDVYILLKEGNLKENGINYIFDEQDRLIACKENFYVTHNLLTNKNVIILNGNKSNYNFLRQFVEKEQFCGVTNSDKLHLEDLERQLKDKQEKKK